MTGTIPVNTHAREKDQEMSNATAPATKPARKPRPTAEPAVKLHVEPKPARPSKAVREAAARSAEQTTTLRIAIAKGIGGVGIAVLTLSVWHCTEAITLLTGSPMLLSGLLAIGIDAGMVMCELAELIGDGSVKRWARGYIGLSVLMSMGLNAYAFAQHATVAWAGAACGIIIPALVLILGRVAGHLAKPE